MFGCGIGPMFDGTLPVSTFTPAELNLEWRWRADDAVINAGTMTVPDSEGNGYDISGGTHPSISTFPGSTRPSLLFNGTTQHLDGSKIGIPNTSGVIYTFVYVAYYTATGNRFVADLNTNAGTNGVAFDQGLDGVGPSLRKKGVSSDGTSDQKLNVPIYVEHLFRINSAGTTPSVTRINGIVAASSAPTANIVQPTGTTFGVGWFSSGATFFMSGHIGEQFLMVGALTTPDRAALAGYMNRYWSIT